MRILNVMSGQGTISVIHCATTMPVAGMEETAHLILMILGKTALQPCSVGATSMMESVMASATALVVSMMALIVRDRKDNASKSRTTKQTTFSYESLPVRARIQSPSFLPAHCMTCTVKITMLMATVTRAATMLNVNGMAWTVQACQRSLQMGT